MTNNFVVLPCPLSQKSGWPLPQINLARLLCLKKAANERQVVSNETVWQLTAYLFIPVIAAVIITITQPRFSDTLESRRRTLASHVPSRTAI